MTVALSPPYDDLTFLSPLSEQRADELVRFLADGKPALVLDLGCGWAELLLRVVAAVPAVRGLGFDPDPDAIAYGRQQAMQRGLSERVELSAGDARTAPDGADAMICIGASQIWGSPTAEEQPLDYSGALAAVRSLLSRGGRIVFGEAIWSAPPTDHAVAALSGRRDEFVTLAELVELAVAAEFMPIAVAEAGLEEWDRFESGFSACYARWLAEHDVGHPDAAEVRTRAAEQRRGYFAGYRGVLGMAYLSLVAV